MQVRPMRRDVRQRHRTLVTTHRRSGGRTSAKRSHKAREFSLTNQSVKPGARVYRRDIDGELPLKMLIASRLKALDLTKAGLARRMGYESTPEKGMRRLEAFVAGELKLYNSLKESLTRGLAVEEMSLDEAVADTRYVLWARADRMYRREFNPHVVWDTTLSIPSPITVAGLIDARRGLFWFPGAIDPARISDEASSTRPEGVACYGRVIGFYVNYSPDCAVRFNQLGEPIEVSACAVRPGFSSASVAGRVFNRVKST